MKKYLILLTLIYVLFACNKVEQPGKIQDDTPEEILIAVQNAYTVSSVTESGQEYQFTFASVTPISLKKEYPEGIPSLAVKKTSVSELHDDGKHIEVIFTSGNKALLTYDSWLQVEFQTDVVAFSDDRNTGVVSFLVKETDNEEISVTVSGHEGFSTLQTEYNSTTHIGTVSFSCTSSDYFARTVLIEVSNGKQSVRHEISVTRVNFKFADGSVSKSFEFQDYERYFEIEMSKADKSVYVVVPDECSGWVKARMSNENVNGVDQTTVCILISENQGSVSRKAQILVKKEGYDSELPVDISQIGSEMDGSFRKGLVSFYKGLNGSFWENNQNWCTDKPMFEWFGVSACNRVNKEPFGEKGEAYFGTDDRWTLNLTANNMRGEIPLDFWKICRCFEIISITQEYLPTSTVPDCVWHEGLYSLDLSYSFMNVPLSAVIGKASNLHELSLQSCNVAGGIPDAITTLSHLSYLNMRECGLTGALPNAIGNLKELKTCLLDINPDLRGILPESFYDMESLVDFNIFATKIGGKLSSRISNLHRLQSFYISGCEFEGTIPEEFGQLDNIIGYEFDGNYFTEIPQFVRYIGFNCRRNGKTMSTGDWVGSAGFPLGVPYSQRSKADGRPENYIVTVPDILEFPEILVDGKPLKRPGYYIDYKLGHQLPFPLWAKVKYGIFCWEKGHIDEMKYPVFPVSDDLQYPANEYYYDGKDWRHPKLQYPAREYYYDGSSWVHDASCPWDSEYIEPDN